MLWLDDLECFLRGLTPRVLDTVVAHRAVVITTMRTGRRSMMSHVPQIPGHAGSGASVDDLSTRVLKRATTVHWDRLWSDEEIEKALEVDDPRIEAAALLADTYGVAEYLAAGPTDHGQYLRAWSAGGHPERQR